MRDDLISRPTSDQLRSELDRLSKKRGGAVIGRILLVLLLLIVVAAALVILFIPGYVIYGDSMSPALVEDDVVLAWPYGGISRGDIIAFNYGERVLIKRAVAGPGDTVDFLEDGTLILNGEIVLEDYAQLTPPGSSEMSYPVTVPSGSWFVLGDNRENSVDSRNVILGFINEDDIVGRVPVRIWPLDRLKLFK